LGTKVKKKTCSESLLTIPHIKTHLYGPELWFPASREDSRQRAFGNTVATRVSETKMKKARGE